MVSSDVLKSPSKVSFRMMLDTFSISAVVSDKFPWLSWLVELVDMLLCKIFWLKFNPKSVNRL